MSAFPLPRYHPDYQARIDQNAAEIREWLDEISPGTLEWMREDLALVQTMRAVISDILVVEDLDAQTVRILAWIQFLCECGAA